MAFRARRTPAKRKTLEQSGSKELLSSRSQCPSANCSVKRHFSFISDMAKRIFFNVR